MKSRILLVAALVLVLCLFLGTSATVASVSMGTDCFKAGCHEPGKPPTAESVVKPKAPVPAPAPAPVPKAEPAKTEKKPEPAAPVKKPAPALKAPAQVTKLVSISAFGKTQEFQGTVEGKTVLLPLRQVADLMGATLGWEQKTGVATIKYGNQAATISTKQAVATVNGQLINVEAKGKNVGGRVWAPLSFVIKVFGQPVSGDPQKDVIFKEGF
ncbi:MAG: copper amine oxidase N-terminal domain-containing protein [Bacillota bacterium]